MGAPWLDSFWIEHICTIDPETFWVIVVCREAVLPALLTRCVHSRTQCWIPVGQLGTTGWWSEFTVTATASHLLTAGHCRLTNMGARYPFFLLNVSCWGCAERMYWCVYIINCMLWEYEKSWFSVIHYGVTIWYSKNNVFWNVPYMAFWTSLIMFETLESQWFLNICKA